MQDLQNALYKLDRARDAWKSVGTLGIVSYYSRSGLLPYRNNQFSGVPRDKSEFLSSRWYTENLAVRALSCSPGCISGCTGTYKIKGNESPAAKKYAGETGHRFELLAQMGWGGMCDISDTPAVAHLWKMSNTHGVDAIEVSFCCAFLMELWQRKIIDEADILEWVGQPVSFDWGSYEAAATVIESMALQNNKLGRIFKDGICKAAKRIEEIKGVNVMQYAIYGKGGLPGPTDARTNPSWAIAMAVSSRGADHLKGALATVERFSRTDMSMQHFGRPEAAEAGTPTLKGADCARGENRCAMTNSLGVCSLLVTSDTILYPTSLFSGALTACCGDVVTDKDLEIAGERTVNIEKAFNSRVGLRREDDLLSDRWMNEPQVDRPAKAPLRDLFEQVKDEYYEAHGWDKKTSLQTRRKLVELGMADVAAVLAKDRAVVD
ncbi:MAG: aldehyde ferredoxin oxidoreductase C-terminal domain-containing protein [Dehalococcoidia bacterium]|nr:aldehyde ferredoxin oxidoreductase C-terminal domain-containing protein [Dehalococcoidia bacterium]